MTKPIKIILFSDNHGQTHCVDWLRNTYSDADYFMHCGDSELPDAYMKGIASVQGNNDWFGSYPQRRVLNVGKHKIFLTHGHRDMFFNRYEMLADRAKEFECDIAFCGHSHIPHEEIIDGVICLNPGSIWRNRDGSKPSYLIVTMEDEKVTWEFKEYEYKRNR